MIRRYVYPYKDMFFYNRMMYDKAYQLQINSDSEDGYCWFGIRNAIKSYCEEYGCSIENVEWLVQVKPDDYDYATIKAKDLDDFEKQFEALHVEYQIR